MIDYYLILLLVVMIPVTALADYFAFRKRFAVEYGTPMKWDYFIIPCSLEIGLFVLGYVFGKGLP